jgi:hypothetical protein
MPERERHRRHRIPIEVLRNGCQKTGSSFELHVGRCTRDPSLSTSISTPTVKRVSRNASIRIIGQDRGSEPAQIAPDAIDSNLTPDLNIANAARISPGGS